MPFDTDEENGTRPQVGRKVLSKEERADLLNFHVRKLREQTQTVEKARGPLSEAQQELTARFNEAKVDLGKGYSRKRLAGLVTDSMARARDLVQEERDRADDKIALGQPVYGHEEQRDLWSVGDETPQEAKDELAWEFEGFMRGRAATLPEIPDGAPTRFHQTIMRAYEAGQKVTQEVYLRAEELRAKRSEPDSEAAPVDLNAEDAEPEPEPTIAEEKAAESRSVRRARQSLQSMKAKADDAEAAAVH